MKYLIGPRRWILVSGFVAVGLFVGEVGYKLSGHLGRLLSLDREFRVWGPVSTWNPNLPALLSFGVLVYGGLAWLRVRTAFDRAVAAPVTFGLFLLFMSIDEFVGLHELLEGMTGIDWQLLYLPIMALAGVMALLLLLQLRRRGWSGAALTLIVGAFLWVVAQALEFVQWDGDRKRGGYVFMMTAEEVLEFVGSAAFALAALIVAEATRARSGASA